MDLKSDKLDKAAKQQSQFGPIFGDNDIIIHSQPTLTADSSLNLDNSFEFPSALSLTSVERDNLLAGSKYFLVDDFEVFNYEGKASCFFLYGHKRERRQKSTGGSRGAARSTRAPTLFFRK